MKALTDSAGAALLVRRHAFAQILSVEVHKEHTLDCTATLSLHKQNQLIKLYGNHMEQAMHAGQRDEAVTWMNTMYDAIKTRKKTFGIGWAV